MIGGVHMNSQFGVFARCVMRSPTLLRVDVRECGLPPALAERIATTVKHRELRFKGIPVEAYEKSKRQQEEEQQKVEAAEGEGDEEKEGEEGEGQTEAGLERSESKAEGAGENGGENGEKA